ncbi:MAG TPA: PocR ligand-binding domain-containing protein [Methanospirillum sp.]|uniref:PocR ligand-binding domain-containing protein n=1 Tax=Methanospirillum sp. TaxID=45200 RepID=UPI002BFE0992|nr:PocR ligand-binding domain-containing protein [Methanospirillum sp.]HWQ63078.1 PocR ligand-binding domain-containing protein [Methanospirillum sp.]
MITVLTVDDEPTLLEVGRLFLERMSDITVETASSGKEALELLGGRPYDAIIADYDMPEMSGIELLHIVRSRFGDLPFILFTGKGRESVAIDALNAGADFYLQKGGDPRSQYVELASNVRQAVRRKLAEDAIRHKIILLTSPETETESLTFYDVFSIDDIQKIQDAFSSATGVASIITELDGTPITKPSNFCHLCNNIIRKTEKGQKNCYISDAVLGRYHPEGPVISPCLSGGLWDAGTSISIGTRHVANWLIGQVLDEQADYDRMLLYADEIGADRVAFEEALALVPRMSRQQFLSVSEALFIIANQLSLQGLQNVKQAREISRREKIEQDLQAANEQIARAEEELREQINEIRQANQYARHQEQQYQALFMHMSDGHALREMITDGGVVTDYRFIDVNPAFEELIGKSRDKIVGMTGSVVFNRTPPPSLELFTNVYKTGTPTIRVIKHPILQRDIRISVFRPYEGVVSTILSRL